MQTIIGDKTYLPLAARLILEGEVVAFPTETVYGLGANAMDTNAVRRIFDCKGRPQDNPLIVHLADFDRLCDVVAYVPPLARVLYDKFCPGPLTMIMPKGDRIPSAVTAGLDTVGIRFPSHPIARELIAQSCPIAAPSANVSKHVSPTTARHVLEDLDGKIPMLLEGGDAEVGIESTIVDLTGEEPTVLRPGAITAEQIKAVLGEADYYHGEIKEALAPGMKYKHYSPKVPCYLAEAKSLQSALDKLKSQGLRPVLIARDEAAKGIDYPTLSLGKTAAEVQHRIYGALRAAEEYDAAVIEDLSDKKEFFAAMDRIKKATGGNKL